MAAGVVQDVGERVANVFGGAQDAVVVAVGEDGAFAVPQAVEGFGDADEEALHAAGEGVAVLRFGHHVQVVAEHGVVHQAKAEALASLRERRAQRGVLRLAPQVGQSLLQPHRHVHGKA